MSVLSSKSILLDKKSARLTLGITEDALDRCFLRTTEGRYALYDLERIMPEFKVMNYDHTLSDLPVLVKICVNKFELLMFLKSVFKPYNIPDFHFNNFVESVSDKSDLSSVLFELRVLYKRILHTHFDFDKLLLILSLSDFFIMIPQSRNPHTYLVSGQKDWRKPYEISSNGQLFAASLTEPAIWHIANCDSVLYSMIILNCGSWGGLSVYDGTKRLLWRQPSAFTGSFVLEGFCKDGILIDNGYKQALPINTTVNWREA